MDHRRSSRTRRRVVPWIAAVDLDEPSPVPVEGQGRNLAASRAQVILVDSIDPAMVPDVVKLLR